MSSTASRTQVSGNQLQPQVMPGHNAAPGPAEQLMHAVASCITATTNANAALVGVNLHRLRVDLEGDIDLHGIFGLDQTVRPGFGELRATIAIAGDASRASSSLPEALAHCRGSELQKCSFSPE